MLRQVVLKPRVIKNQVHVYKAVLFLPYALRLILEKLQLFAIRGQENICTVNKIRILQGFLKSYQFSSSQHVGKYGTRQRLLHRSVRTQIVFMETTTGVYWKCHRYR